MLDDWTKLPVWTPLGRVAMAGAFWEMGEPLTDEVAATKEYLRLKFGRDDIPPPRVGWNLVYMEPKDSSTPPGPAKESH